MAGPLNGIGGQHSYPISNTYQPGQGGNDIRRQDDAAPRENTVQPRGVAASESQTVQTDDQKSGAALRSQGEFQQTQAYANQSRGSVVDIVV